MERILTLSNISPLMHWTFTRCIYNKQSIFLCPRRALGAVVMARTVSISAAALYFSLLGKSTKAIGRHRLPSTPSRKLLVLEMYLCEYILSLFQSQVD